MIFLSIFCFSFFSLSLSTISLYATEQNIGVTVTSTASSCDVVQACDIASSDCFDGVPLTKISEPNTFVGSIFFLPEDGRTYDVSVTCDGEPPQISQVTLKTWSIPTSFSNTYYVSPIGTGSDCTSSQPCSVDHVFPSLIVPGTEVILKGGQGNYRSFPRISDVVGTKESPILIRGESDVDVFIDGSKDITSSLVTTGINTARYTFLNEDEAATRMVVRVNKLDNTDVQRLLWYHDAGEMAILKWKNDGYYKSGTSYMDINVNTGSLNINDYYFLISDLDMSFEVRRSSYIYFENLKFKYIFGGAYPKAIYFMYDNSYMWVKNCVFDHAKIGYKYGTDSFLIENNLFIDSKFTLSWHAVKGSQAGGVSTGDESGPIKNYGGPPATGRGVTIRRNRVENFFDGLGGAGGADSTFVTSEIDIYENYITKCEDDAIEGDGHVSNVRIYSNIIEEVLVAFSFAPGQYGPVYVINNFIKTLGQCFDADYTGMLLKLNHGYDIPTGKIYLYHNVGISNNADSSVFRTTPTTYSCEGVWTRNNIFLADPGRFAISIGFDPIPYDFDYDALYSSLDNELCWWTDTEPERHLKTIELFRASKNQELSGIELLSSDIFIDADNGNYVVRDGTDPKGKGVFLKGINDGSNPDMGLLSVLSQPIVPEYNVWKNSVFAAVVTSALLIPLVILIFIIFIATIIVFTIPKGWKGKLEK